MRAPQARQPLRQLVDDGILARIGLEQPGELVDAGGVEGLARVGGGRRRCRRGSYEKAPCSPQDAPGPPSTPWV